MGRAENYDDLLDQAWDALEEERAEDALALCDRALRLDPKGPDAHYVRGRALWDLQREREAVAEFDRCLALDDAYYEAMLSKAAAILEMGEDPEEAIPLCDRALGCDPDADSEIWAYELKVDALMNAGRCDKALRAAERAVRAAPDRASLHVLHAWALYSLAQFGEAEASIEGGLRREPDNAYAVNLRAKIRQRLGRTEAAEEDFRRAAQLVPDEYRVPIRLTAREFEALIWEALRDIPLPFRAHLENVQVSAMEFPSEDLIREGFSPDLLGLYQGVTVAEKDRGLLPDKIILFQRTLENVCGTREELRHEIVVTVRHEVGHHFGLSEDELAQIEYGSRNGN